MTKFTHQPTDDGGWEHMDLARLRADAAACSSSLVRAALLRQIDAEELRRHTPAAVQRSCSWCDTMNGADVQLCRTCGHEAQRPRMLCQCQLCSPTGPDRTS